MDSSDERKLFVRGISWDTTEDTLRDYFSKYGNVSEATVMRDKTKGFPRGLGFVVFSDPNVLSFVLRDLHTINGRNVAVRRAVSKEVQETSSGAENENSAGGEGYFRTKTIFAGGLPPSLTKKGFRRYFENYGNIQSLFLKIGYGFVTFDTEEAVDRVLRKTFHNINGKQVEVQRERPKYPDLSRGPRGNRGSGGGGSSANTNASGSKIKDGRYMQPQPAVDSSPTLSGEGYGAATSEMDFGGYIGFGIGDYGSVYPGLVGPAGPYIERGPYNFGYRGARPVYGVSGYRGAAPRGTPVGSGVRFPPVGQSRIRPSGYGSQGSGYGNHGGNHGPSSGGYGAAGGRAQGTKINGNVESSGNLTRRFDRLQASGGPGGGNGGSQPK